MPPVPPRSRRLPPHALAAALLIVAAPVASAAPTSSLAIPGSTLFRGDWETGDTSQWADCQTRHRGGVALTTQVRRQGRRAARFEVTDSDFDGFGERSECQASTREREGKTRWYSWSTFIPADLPIANARAWAVVTQWHCTCPGSPPVGFYLQDESLQLSIHRRDSEGDVGQVELVPWGRPLAALRGRWTDIRVRVRWSASDGRGFVDLWVNGTRQRMNWPRSDRRAARHGGLGAPRVRVRTLVPGGSGAYLKQGLYRSGSIGGRAVIYHDGMRMTAG